MEICDEFKRPVVLLQKKHLNNGEECKNCTNDENTDFCCSGKFSRLENVFFYDNWAMLCNLALIDILISTGIRIAEASDISLNDVIFSERTVLIHGKGRNQRLIYIYLVMKPGIILQNG